MQLTCWWLFAVWSLALANSDPGPVRERRQSPFYDPGSCGPSGCGGNNSIPLNVAWKLSGARDIDDLIENYITNKEDYYRSLADDSGLATRIDDNERSKGRECKTQSDCAGISGTSCMRTSLDIQTRCLCEDNFPPVDGKCIVHHEVEAGKIPLCVPLPTLLPVNPDLQVVGSLILPSCIRVDRCSGCCDNPILECIPTKTEEALFGISRIEIVKEDKHLQCECACKVKAKHCNALQVYNPETCRCECTSSVDEQNACNSKSGRHWDQFTCVCQCEGDTECSTGTEYDNNLCKCVKHSVIPLDQ